MEPLNKLGLSQASMRPIQQPVRSAITLSGVLYALSDPVRLDIVRSLQKGRERCCGEFGMTTKSTLSHHLKVLREAGVTSTRNEGRRRIISLRRSDLDSRFPGLLDAILGAREAV